MTYHKIHDKSADSVLSALDLFESPPTATSVLDGRTVEVQPMGDANASDLDFVHQSSGQNYTDGNKMYLRVQCKVKKADGTAIGEGDDLKVMPTCNFLHNLFMMVTLGYGNHSLAYHSAYPYQAYLETALNSSEGSKKTFGQCSMWIQDKTGVIDTANIGADNKADIDKRKQLIQGSKLIDLCGQLHLSALKQNLYIPPGAAVKIRLSRSTPGFCLVRTADDDTEYRIDIEKCSLMVRQVVVNPAIVNAHNALLASGSDMLIPLNRVDTQMFVIPMGSLNHNATVVVNQQKPKRMFFALSNHAAKNGDYTLDPFNFGHYHLKSIVLEVDGVPIPAKPILCDFAGGAYTDAYYNLCKVTGKDNPHSDCGITKDMFANGYGIYAFDLTPDACIGADAHLIETKTCILNLAFAQPLPHSVNLFCLSERDDLLEIDQSRSIQRLSRL